MLQKFIILILLVCAVQYGNGAGGHYSIVGSKYIRPNSPYHVSVSLHDYSEPCSIKIGVRSSDNVEISELINIEPYTSKLVSLDTSNLKSGAYKLFGDGQTGIIFSNATDINYHGKTFSVFIQTDKSIYKPGDKVQFRVLVLDANTKPALIKGPMNVHINDGKKNRIKQWSNVESTNGVYTNELQLSNFTVLGNWKIVVEVMDDKIEKEIEVAEYVLPKFEVTIDVPSHTTFKEGVVHSIIRSKYTYGKSVKGEVTVSIFPKFHGSYQPLVSNLITRKTAPINGKAAVSFDIKNDMKISDEVDYEKEFIIEAVVEEELTGRKQNTTTTIKLTKSKYKIKTIKDIKSYKPGLPFQILIQIAHHDGTPVRDDVNKVSISYGSNYDRKDYKQTDYSLDSNGMALLSFEDANNVTGISIYAKYLDVEERIGFYQRAESAVNIFLQATLKTENPTINNEVTIYVQSTENMKYFTYQILGRGDVLLTKTIQVPDRKYHTFKFLATFSMVPKAQLIVYFIRDEELITDKLEIEFANELNNFVKIESIAQANPGQDIDLTITTRPNSFVGLLGVDQSVLLLKGGNDLSKDAVFSELEQYNQNYVRRNKRQLYRPYYAYSELWADFDKAGAVILTNAKPPTPTSISTTISPYDKEIIDGSVITTIKKTDIGPAHIFKTNTKPPLAGPYAFSRIPKPYWNRPRIHLMHDIRDTWLFFNLLSGTTGEMTIHKTVPDTITSWIITGFSIDPITGLGLTKTPRKLQVFQPFFVSLNLPYSVKRGETVAIPIILFNYMEENVNAEVTLHNENDEIEFVDATNDDGRETPTIELSRQKRLAVESNAGATTTFMIKPKKIGSIIIKVVAKTPLAGDGIERVLPVLPEGVTQYHTNSLFIDLRENNNLNSNLTINIPSNAVPDSARVSVSVVGDILGSTIKNLDSLIRMPYGCGEQNMINFVPNIVVLNYMKHTNQLTEQIETKAKRFMESGYQRELTYKHKDGSFSVFGKSDKSGSTWLTAFVARAFQQATVHIDIEEKIIDDALDWLSEHQNEKGGFPEVGHVYDSHLQGGANNGIGLTAYTLISFLENKKKIAKYNETINKAINYIVNKTDGLNDIYTLSVASYALQLADHPSKDKVLGMLKSKANLDAERKWWSKILKEEKTLHPFMIKRPSSIDVETTAYALLAHLEAKLYDECIPIVKWLLGQRNNKGGFQSTQDTVVGIQALAKFSEKISSKDGNVNVTVKYTNKDEHTINVNENNAVVLQTYDLPGTTEHINVNANGNGFAVLQLAYQYNVNDMEPESSFRLRTSIKDDSNSDNLHLNVCTRSEGRTTIHKKLPDSITSWSITGFSIDPVTGIGVVRQPKTLDVVKPFFVTINLPYSIKLGETIAIPIVVFNFMDKNVSAEITLYNTAQEFDFTDFSNEINDTPNNKIELNRKKRLNIESNAGAATSFMLKPKKVGSMLIKVGATTSLAGDTIERLLIIEPEGSPQYRTKSQFLDLRENSEIETNFTLEIPKNFMHDSIKIDVSVVGDLLGASIKNLDHLIRLPYGCGEQNMIYFVPNIVVMNYLRNTKQMTPAIEIKAKKFMEIGYQRQLTYRHDDGSFSAFGLFNETGSTWLTAFVARTFRQAAEHIDIEERIIDDALNWLSNMQESSGSFPEFGNVYHKEMQGGANNGIGLTAFTLLAFLENKNKGSIYRNTINRAMDYIVRNLEGVNDNYVLAIASYALQLAEHNSESFILQSLDTKAINKDDKKYWIKSIPESDKKNIWYTQPNSINIEITSYGLLAFLEAGYFTQALPIMKWLIEQRNDQGGFQSTQDTFVGLQALAKYAEKLSSINSNVQVTIKYNDGMETRMNVNQDNAIVLQSYELPNIVRAINVTAKGRGYGIVQLSYKYNINVTGAWPRFTLDPLVNRNSNPDYLQLTVCTSFVPTIGVNESNMAVMEVNFPSGFTVDVDTLPSLIASENIKRVETKNDDTVVIIYFVKLTTKELCPTIDAFRTHKVANHKPAAVIIYDYYDNSRRSRQFYKARKTTLCDICEGEDCTESCRILAAERIAARDSNINDNNEKINNSKASTLTIPSIFLTISILLLLNKFNY